MAIKPDALVLRQRAGRVEGCEHGGTKSVQMWRWDCAHDLLNKTKKEARPSSNQCFGDS